MKCYEREEIGSLSRVRRSGDRKAQEGDSRGRVFPGRAEEGRCTELAIGQVHAGRFGGAGRRGGSAQLEGGSMAFCCFQKH